jgi:hypothetical protein
LIANSYCHGPIDRINAATPGPTAADIAPTSALIPMPRPSWPPTPEEPERRARCGIRDTRAPGGERFLWIVTLLGHFRTIATGRTAERAEARTLAEAALNGYVADWRELWDGDGSDG